MYVTRPLSVYLRNSSDLSTPPEARNSSFMIIRDGESEQYEDTTCCCGIPYAIASITKLPLPQNTILNSNYEADSGSKFLFIPVFDQPLSSSRYYVIHAEGLDKGLACTCSKEEDTTICCLRKIVDNAKPMAFDHSKECQQFEICSDDRDGFYAKSIVVNGSPPIFLRSKGLQLRISKSYLLNDAQGLVSSPLNHLPEFNFPISGRLSTPITIGKWYCPFVFVKEQWSLSNQMKKSLFYNLTLEQYWEDFYCCENDGNKSNVMLVNASDVQNEVMFLAGIEAVKESGSGEDGFIWFRALDQDSGRGVKLGFCSAITQQMRNLQEARGWMTSYEMVERQEEIRSEGGWKKICKLCWWRVLL